MIAWFTCMLCGREEVQGLACEGFDLFGVVATTAGLPLQLWLSFGRKYFGVSVSHEFLLVTNQCVCGTRDRLRGVPCIVHRNTHGGRMSHGASILFPSVG